MLLRGIFTTLGFYFSAAAQTVPTLTVDLIDASRVVPGSIYLAPNNVPGAGPYVFNLTGVSHQSLFRSNIKTTLESKHA